MSSTMSATITLRYEVATLRDDWVLPEEPVPESQPHDQTIDLLKAILLHRVLVAGLDAQIARNLAVRFIEARPAVGVDPDLCVIAPRTPEGDELESLCTWREGHAPPLVAIEIVSASHPHKDYVTAPEKYAASGTHELWVFDPKLAGPKGHGGPQRIQVWRRSGEAAFDRVYAGEGPAYSPAMNGWLFAVDEGRRLRLADDREGTAWWPTAEEAERMAKEAALAAAEAERVAKEAERVARETERVAKEALLARVAELEATLAAKRR